MSGIDTLFKVGVGVGLGVAGTLIAASIASSPGGDVASTDVDDGTPDHYGAPGFEGVEAWILRAPDSSMHVVKFGALSTTETFGSLVEAARAGKELGTAHLIARDGNGTRTIDDDEYFLYDAAGDDVSSMLAATNGMTRVNELARVEGSFKMPFAEEIMYYQSGADLYHRSADSLSGGDYIVHETTV